MSGWALSNTIKPCLTITWSSAIITLIFFILNTSFHFYISGEPCHGNRGISDLSLKKETNTSIHDRPGKR
jgi:hypothetical protein